MHQPLHYTYMDLEWHVALYNNPLYLDNKRGLFDVYVQTDLLNVEPMAYHRHSLR